MTPAGSTTACRQSSARKNLPAKQMKRVFPHLDVDTGDQRKWVATPARKLTNYRAIPYHLVLSSASKTSGTAHDATFVFKHQPWGLDPLMDLARTKFKLRVESFTVTGVKNAPGDTEVAGPACECGWPGLRPDLHLRRR